MVSLNPKPESKKARPGTMARAPNGAARVAACKLESRRRGFDKRV